MDLFDAAMQFDGTIRFDGVDTRRWRNVYALRKRIGVVFPLPVGLPLTVYDNVALAPRLAGTRSSAELDVIVERCLRRAALWDEVKDRLRVAREPALGRAAAAAHHRPRALPGPRAAHARRVLDRRSTPVTTMRIEDVLEELRGELTIILVTNLVQQARRLADRTALFLEGSCIEIGETEALFAGEVADTRTRDYIEGKFG